MTPFIKLAIPGKSEIVRNKTPKPTSIFICIPTANIFICGATFARIPRIQFKIIIQANIGRKILKPITNRSVIYCVIEPASES